MIPTKKFYKSEEVLELIDDFNCESAPTAIVSVDTINLPSSDMSSEDVNNFILSSLLAVEVNCNNIMDEKGAVTLIEISQQSDEFMLNNVVGEWLSEAAAINPVETVENVLDKGLDGEAVMDTDEPTEEKGSEDKWIVLESIIKMDLNRLLLLNAKLPRKGFATPNGNVGRAPANKTPKDIMEQVIQFIKRFPTLPSHYCRKDSKLLYLEPGLSLFKMYTMYTEDTAINHKHVSKKIFDKIFHSLDLFFNNPRKDQCDTCVAYKQGSVDSVSFQEHIEMKDRARHFKALDKELAAENDTLKVVTMDMQQLLLCPKSFASAVYYKRKLSVHNFTLYDLKSKDVFCYLWHEGQGGLDSDEFASIIVDFLLSVPDNVESVIFWSDGCTYQNCNADLSSAIKYMFVNNLKPTLKEVHPKYLTRGHTQMEADSVHAAIETNSSKIEVYTPTEWETVIKTARLKNPYNVKTGPSVLEKVSIFGYINSAW
ncbi:hypothetical protein Bpfe_014631 [Biomphalaria pfeifferi]|uniref:Uncharacterized protein n=1 Tax=Biomphalaria pfeifferi TaxID=112525 RepID=A0AAD8BJW1_BIOPF|nr:hypothetical protein Bpfe_014631 [Biomphalaria pfeifferi]